MLDFNVVYQYNRPMLNGTNGQSVDLNQEIFLAGYRVEMEVFNTSTKLPFIPGIYEPFGQVYMKSFENNTVTLSVQDIWRPFFNYDDYFPIQCLLEVLKPLNRHVTEDDCEWLLHNYLNEQAIQVFYSQEPVPMTVKKDCINNLIQSVFPNIVNILASGQLSWPEERFMTILYGYKGLNLIKSVCQSGYAHVVGMKVVRDYIQPTIYTVPINEFLSKNCDTPNGAATWYGMMDFKRIPINDYAANGC